MSHGAASRDLPFGIALPSAVQQREKAASVRATLYLSSVAFVTLSAFALRLVLLDRFPFREDEAAYAYWALHGWLEDPMFLQVWPDKPPIFLWLLGGAFRLFGVSEASARWVNIAASTLLIPVTAATARRLWGRRAALTAAAVLALSPYAIGFAPTAYTDPVLVLAGMSAICAAVYGRGLPTGVLLGAAVMTKQQGVFYTPLVIGLLWLDEVPAASHSRQRLRRYAWFVAGAALVTLPILYWDSLRWAVAPSPWDLSVRNYASLALLDPGDWPARAAMWRPLLWDLGASWAAWAAMAALLLGGVAAARWGAAETPDQFAHNTKNHCEGSADRRSVLARGWVSSTVRRYKARFASRDVAILLIAGWSVVLVAAHVTTTVQPWDRYLLPLAPMLALAAGWAVAKLGRVVSGAQMAAVGAAGVLLLISPALEAAQGGLAVGGDHGDYAGLTEAIEAVQQASDGPFILYHRELGSQYRFYLYGRTQDAGRGAGVDLRWFPSTVYLADNAAKMPYPRKFLIEPEWASLRDLTAHLGMRGLVLEPKGRHGRFAVWEITRARAALRLVHEPHAVAVAGTEQCAP